MRKKRNNSHLQSQVDGFFVQPHGRVDVHACALVLVLSTEPQSVLQVVVDRVRILRK